jgi:flagellar protein FliL
MAMAKKEKSSENEETAEGAGKKSKKKLLLIVLPLVLTLGGGGYFFMGRSADSPTETTVAEPVEGEVVVVEAMTVNLPEDHYAKVGFALVLSAEAIAKEVEAHLPLMKDAALEILTGFDAEELESFEGMERLKAELSAVATEEFEGQVLRVVLTELLVQ